MSGFPPSFTCPVIICSDEQKSLWVTGMPAYAAAAIAEVMPALPQKVCRFDARTPAPLPLPNTKGSPPLSLTTILASSALARRILFISC